MFGGLIIVAVLMGAFIFLFFQKKMTQFIKSASYEMMEKNNRSFLDLAKYAFENEQEKYDEKMKHQEKSFELILKPLQTSLEKMQSYHQSIEKQREGAYESLNKQIELLVNSEKDLRVETANLATALKNPNMRGAWGQVHLKRVVEIAGLVEHCDFSEQVNVQGSDRSYRPDLLVRLPECREIIVDAKTPLAAYLEAHESMDPNIRKQKFLDHARHVKNHIKDLSRKEYWKHFSKSPEYVVLFLPAESFFSSALEADPTLLEFAAKGDVIIATPTTLIAILRSIAFSWKQDAISKESQKIAKVGQELYERAGVFASHLEKIKTSLSQTVDAYNQASSSLESRLLVSARKLQEYGAVQGQKEIKKLDTIEKILK